MQRNAAIDTLQVRQCVVHREQNLLVHRWRQPWGNCILPQVWRVKYRGKPAAAT
jgi:hypothetical protein